MLTMFLEYIRDVWGDGLVMFRYCFHALLINVTCVPKHLPETYAPKPLEQEKGQPFVVHNNPPSPRPAPQYILALKYLLFVYINNQYTRAALIPFYLHQPSNDRKQVEEQSNINRTPIGNQSNMCSVADAKMQCSLRVRSNEDVMKCTCKQTCSATSHFGPTTCHFISFPARRTFLLGLCCLLEAFEFRNADWTSKIDRYCFR